MFQSRGQDCSIAEKYDIPPHIHNPDHSLPKGNVAEKQPFLLHRLQHDLKSNEDNHMFSTQSTSL